MNQAEEDFDLVVIGAGTGGIGVARACAKEGWHVAIADALPYGGTCALRGCDPKKMLVSVTETLDRAERMSGRGLRTGGIRVDWSEMMAFKRTFTDSMPARLEAGFGELGIETLHGTARFVTPNQVRIGDRTLRSRYVHIATGARPATLGIPGEELLSTSTDFLNFDSLPERIVFVGGGFISFEFAHIVRRAGASEVTVLHRGAQPLANFDPDLVSLLLERTRSLGIDVRLESCVEGVEKTPAGLQVRVDTPTGQDVVLCDVAIHGAGRVPNLEALDLHIPGVKTSRRGITVTPEMRSVSNPAIFAVGDCADTGAPKLTPVSAREGRIAAKNLLAGAEARHITYPPIPSTVFTVPPLASVGLLEEAARAEGIEFHVQFQKTADWYSSVRVAERFTAHKVLIEKGTGRIVGAHVLGPGAEEQINLFAMAMGAELTANQVKAVIFAYPSYGSDLASMV